MKAHQLLRTPLLLAAGLFLSSAAAHAAVYRVTIDTSTLAATGNGPFALDFQFNGGDTPGNNTAVISSFTFGGGSALAGTNVATTSDVSGTLATTVTLANTLPFNEFYQQFNPGGLVQFDINVTQNLDGVTPDSFAFAILDKDFFNIDTTGSGDNLVTFNIDTAGTLTVNTSQGQGVYSGVTVNVSAVPEPSTALIGLLAGGLGMCRRRRTA